MKKSLFQISAEALELASALEEGELTPEMETALTINRQELEIKAKDYAYAVKSIQADIDVIQGEIARLTALKKAKESAVERMKESVLNAMRIYEIEKIASPTMTISIRRSEAVEVYDNLDSEYMTEKVTYAPDKIRIKNSIKTGENVPGARIVENFNLVIK